MPDLQNLPLHEWPEDTRLVNIVTCQGESYDTALEAIEADGGSTDAAVAYLSQWDQGQDTDAADDIYGPPTTAGAVRKWQHQLHVVQRSGLVYLLVLDHLLGLYSLYRQPLSA